ncbi:hypothetical protein VHEMI04323 [[Torrubiella] hemipterigena]|nr:hypothetical protein VHEMI04323 [[Torrubiella] hemipterigena]
MWLRGPAGFGKTFVCARIVAHLASTLGKPLGFFFMSSGIGSSCDPFRAMRWWLSQILDNRSVLTIFRSEWLLHPEPVTTRGSVVRLFERVVREVPGCTFVLDGLDECVALEPKSPHAYSELVSEFLSIIWKAAANTNTRIMVVSRDMSEIRRSIPDTGFRFFEHNLTIEDNQQDVALYSMSIVNKRLGNKSTTLRENIAKRMADRCEGQFQWLYLQSKTLERLRSFNEQQLEQKIGKTPKELSSIYESTYAVISRSDDYDRSRAIAILRWVAFAIRPLSVNEITAALLVEEETKDFPVEDLPDEIDEYYVDDLIIAICGGLIELRKNPTSSELGLQTLHLPHFSVKEFLLPKLTMEATSVALSASPLFSAEYEANTKLAISCLQYINFDNVWVDDGVDDSDTRLHVLRSFQEYASISWHQHMQKGECHEPSLTRLLLNFFGVHNRNWCAWVKALPDDDGMRRLGRLHCVCYLNLPDVAANLIHQALDINETTMSGSTPLFIASREGYIAIVKLLLDNGADVSKENKYGRTPLHEASGEGHTDVVELLLGYGVYAKYRAYINKKDNYARTALYCASAEGHVSTIEVLINKGADIHHTNIDGIAPLHAASQYGYIEVVKVLFNNGAEINTRDCKNNTPLHAASFAGHLEIVRFLVIHKATISAANETGVTPLHRASDNGHIKVLKVLLENDADINSTSRNGETALFRACLKGNLDIVRVLIEYGASTSLAKKNGRTPLHIASEHGYTEVAKTLLNNGAAVDALDLIGSTPLHVASANGHLAVVELLINSGADANITDRDGESPLAYAVTGEHFEIAQRLFDGFINWNTLDTNDLPLINLAAYIGHVETVHRFIDLGGDISATAVKDHTPLLSASAGGHVELARLLVQNCSHIDATGEDGCTALYLASERGNVELVKMLLENNADINIAHKNGFSVLHAACRNSSLDVVKVLLDYGIDINVSHDLIGRASPIFVASMAGHCELIQLLIDKGADISAMDNEGNVPLHFASSFQKVEATRVLLDNGAEIQATNDEGETALHLACKDGHLDVVELLLKNGADVNALDNQGRTPLFQASVEGHINVTEVLLNNSADPSVRDSDDHTSLYPVSPRRSAKPKKPFLKTETTVDVADNSGLAPLHAAASVGHLEVVKVLIKHGANINCETKDGWSPLHWSCFRRKPQIVDHLLQCGAEPSCVDIANRSPVFFAAAWGHGSQMLESLLSYGAVFDSKDCYGATPLLASVRKNNIETVRCLLSTKRVSLDVVDKSGRSLSWWASHNRNQEIMDMLIKHGVSCQAISPDMTRDTTIITKKAPKYCDACWQGIYVCHRSYYCDICSGGTFELCYECFSCGLGCFKETHQLK